MWNGTALPPHAQGAITLTGTAGGDILVDVDARTFGDPLPPGAPGSTDRLWEYEVVELFLAGAGRAYLEVELGPGGHYLVLMLDDIRAPQASGLPLEYRVRMHDGRISGHARIPANYLPVGPLRANAYAIHAHACHGGEGRCHHAHAAVPGDAPDFHQPGCFVPISLEHPAGGRQPG